MQNQTDRDEFWRSVKNTQKNLEQVSISQKETAQQMKETDRKIDKLLISQKETDRKMKETDRKMQETAQQMKETDRKMKETDRKMQETDIKIKETAQQMKETDKKLKAFIGETGNRWGKLGENLVKGSLAQRLKERNITVERVITNMKGPTSEFDIVAINGTEVVVIEVKSTLDPSDVEKFKKAMESFKALWPHFKDKKVYGGLAYLMGVNRNADSLAKKEGFFVISATGDVIIQNKKGFKPRMFS